MSLSVPEAFIENRKVPFTAFGAEIAVCSINHITSVDTIFEGISGVVVHADKTKTAK